MISSSYEHLAYFYWVKGDVEKSIINYQNDICNLVQVPYNNNFFRPPDVSKSIDDNLLTDALRNQADVFYEFSKTLTNVKEKKKYLEAGLSFFELSLKVATRYKFSLYREDKKLNYTDILNRIYSKLTEVCFELHKETNDPLYTYKAFEYAEKSKASLLLSMMRGTDARKLSMIPKNFADKEDQIENATSYYLKLLAEENEKTTPNFAQIENYNTQLQFINQKQDSLIQIIKSGYPAYYNAKFNNDVIRIDSLKKQLNSKQVMVLYTLSKDYLDIFLISNTSFKVWHNKADKSLFDDIALFRKFVSTYTFDYSNDTSIYSFAKVSNRLYNSLLGPVRQYIKNKELIIVPDGELNTIPFEPLVTDWQEQVKSLSYRELPYLIKRNIISYNYSATLYTYTCKQNTKVYKGSKLLAVAPSNFNIQMSAITNMNTNDLRRDTAIIAPIPGTLEEVKKIHKIFNGKLLIKQSATETNFLKYAGKYNIIHIASHGLVNNEYPLFSKLVFSPENSTLNDSYLNTYEIYNMELSAPLVVLSACNTGYGKIYKGEGIISLARGFFIAGAKNVVMTQWAVADKTSNKLMRNFYKYLSEKEQIAEALQSAKIEYLDNCDEITSHPYFWAGYVSAGNTSVSFEREGFFAYKKIWIGSLSIILITGLILFNNRKKRISGYYSKLFNKSRALSL
jgi:CHAT domain-containing protein